MFETTYFSPRVLNNVFVIAHVDVSFPEWKMARTWWAASLVHIMEIGKIFSEKCAKNQCKWKNVNFKACL